MRTKDLFYWIKERHKIHLLHDAKASKPWTMDPILQTYRFCNVHREDDKVTRWIRENWREPHKRDPYLFFAMTVARLLNLPATLETLGYPVPFDSTKFLALKSVPKGVRVFNSAYIVSTNGRAMNKLEYLNQYVLEPMWGQRDHVASVIQSTKTLAAVHKELLKYQGLGNFMAAQIVADIKYVYGPLSKTTDWDTFAASGPGSRRGLNRVLGRDKLATWNEGVWHESLLTLKSEIDPLAEKADIPRIHAQDLQNCLCEFDKYERVRLNEGRPKSLYPGAR